LLFLLEAARLGGTAVGVGLAAFFLLAADEGVGLEGLLAVDDEVEGAGLGRLGGGMET
jgi:hypothetical protein